MSVFPHLDALKEKAAALPAFPGVYLYKDGRGRVIYVGKAKSLRDRVRSYFLEDKLADAKTGTLLSEARDIDYIAVANEKEALALENNLIKQRQPRYNVLLRDDKTYPYIKLTRERFPRVYVTRRLRKDGSTYYGPYFPGNLAHRIVRFIHRYFRIPSCRVDLTRNHPRPCLEYHIQRCWGPCVAGLTTDAVYGRAVADVRAFLEGRHTDLIRDLRHRMQAAAEEMEFEQAAALRDLIATVDELKERQRVAAVEGRDIDIFGVHAEPPLVAVNLFHVRNGRVVDRREFYWENVDQFEKREFLSSLLMQIYLDAQYVPSLIHVPVDFDDRDVIEELLSERRKRKVVIATPQRGSKRAMLDLVETNARHGFEQRFRVMKPSSKAIMDALVDALNLSAPPERIECFDISHIQGSDTVASMVVWENGRMKKGDYRKFIIKTVDGIDDFSSMREAVTRRYRRLQDEQKPFPGLILIDGGVGQLHATVEALEALGIINQSVAAIAKREEIIYVAGQEDEPVYLDRFSPVLHLMQKVRDEAHRFAVAFHRKRRGSRRLKSVLLEIPGVGEKTARRLLRTLGSLNRIETSSLDDLQKVVGQVQAERIHRFFAGRNGAAGT
ncbi:MAG: excinuclease ABC subunit UvrC [Bryobacterales bacterium]|nr:excinuclease ABC subunit UvrC [Bryobacterales bacterium]MDE0295223.1 excinuclease ABC subunit UvrC [Bryobacterales bacterium]